MTKVMMIIICWMPEGSHLKETWRIERQTTMEHCRLMNDSISHGGTAAVITVRCRPEIFPWQ